MKTDEIDKIIAEALDAEKKKKTHKGKPLSTHNGNRIAAIRKILNIVFIIGFIAAIIIYFVFPEQKILFFSIGFGALALKIVEFFLRFMF